MTPAVSAIVFIENGYSVRRAGMLNQLRDRILTGNQAGRTLNRMDAADKIQGINNQHYLNK